MDLGIKNRTALVLGAGGGLGSAIATALAREGANIAIADRDGGSLLPTKAAVEAHGTECASLEWDLADISAIDTHVTSIEAKLGPVEILVNITGGPPPTTVSGQTADQWRSHFDSMVLSVIALSDRVLPSMIENSWGRILTSTSSGVISPIPNLGLSNALRMALVGWSKTLAGEVGKHGVTSNIILPGRVATRRIQFLDEQKAGREGRSTTDVSRESEESIPLKRYGTPEEYADVAAFLTSERASYITGSVIRVDGGFVSSV